MELAAAVKADPMSFGLIVIVAIGLVAGLVWLMRRGQL